MAERLELPLWVGSGEGEGTWIMGRTVDEVFRACAVVSDENLALLSAEGCGSGGCAVAEEFFLRGIHILAAAESGCPSFYIRRERLEEAAEICRRMSGKSPSVNPGAARVSVVGPGAGNHPEIGRAMLKVLGRLGAPAHLLTSSGLSVSCYVDEKDAQPALRALHEEFIEKKGEFQCA
jgi:aspartate kinase